MTTRTYYLPKNRIAIHVINYLVSKVGCSIGDLKVNQTANTIRVPVTCNDVDVCLRRSVRARRGSCGRVTSRLATDFGTEP